jgi:hypothetical protein
MEEREPFDLDVPDEPEPSTDDVDADAVEDADWTDTPGGAPAH